MRFLPLIIAGLFILFAAVQLNDPDPWAWVVLYLAAAGVLLLAQWKQFHLWVGAVGLIVVIGWMAFLIPEVMAWIELGMPSITESMKAEQTHIEYTREFLGLLLCGLAFGWYARKAWKS